MQQRSEQDRREAAADTPKGDLDVVLEGPVGRPERIDGVVLGELVAVDAGSLLVDFPGNPAGGPVVACSTAVLTEADVGVRVALAFTHGDPRHPLVLGRIAGALRAEVDGAHVELEAAESIVLRCGKASLTMTKDGKIVLRGVQIVSRASGANKIRGGTILLN